MSVPDISGPLLWTRAGDPEVDPIQPNCGYQVWQRREIHALEKLALSLEWLFQEASIARAKPSVHRRGN